jgi:hypothetical protein
VSGFVPLSGVVRVFTRNVYGVDLIYPANHEADVFCKLAGKATLTMKHLDLIRSIGFTVEQTLDPRVTGRSARPAPREREERDWHWGEDA